MNFTRIRSLDMACPGSSPPVSKRWSLKLPEGAGIYRVYIYAGMHKKNRLYQLGRGDWRLRASAKGGIHGCSIENVRLAEEWTARSDTVGGRGWLQNGVMKACSPADDIPRSRKLSKTINWIIVEKIYQAPDPAADAYSQPGTAFAEESRVHNNLDSVEECVALVKSTWPKNNDPRIPDGMYYGVTNKDCYATFGLTHASANANWKVCKFGETLPPVSLAQFQPMWLPSNPQSSGIVWEMEAGIVEDIGFVSMHYDGVKSEAGKEIGYGETSCRSRWPFSGIWCVKSSPFNTGPWWYADATTRSFHIID